MQQTPFHAYYTARMLDSLSEDDRLVSAFASSDIKVYPFQIAAARFALRSPYQKGVILCDEAGMGKSHEAMLAVSQKWLEGCNHILFAIPNSDLLCQWVELIERYYTIPYVVLTSRQEWEDNIFEDNPNAFDRNAIVITTYDFASDNEPLAAAVHWDMTVFEEANALSSVYQEDSKLAKSLHRIAGDSFKLLLTGTPIEKNIMDLYGLIWFIDSTSLPDEREFLARYLRRPEHYPELAERVSKYCFRTLRSQAKEYAKVPERLLITHEYSLSRQERNLYELIYAYIKSPVKKAFPEMNPYDLTLRLFSLQSSSTTAISQTAKGIIKRLKTMPDAEDELAQWLRIQETAGSIRQDAKAKELLSVLKSGFGLMKKAGANRKAVIFSESVETQKMLNELLRDRYKTFVYNGTSDYSAIRAFKDGGEILLSTDNGAKGFNLEEAAFVIHYDLPYNTLKMEQRIDRCHRLGQENDVLSFAFIDKNNFSDVRKLELINKRMLVADGVFGITDDLIGGFTDDLEEGFRYISGKMRTKTQIEAEYQQALSRHEEQNRKLVSTAEDILFTTFTRELANKVHITPQYVSDKTNEINTALWNVVRWFFEQYNAAHTDCVYIIDDDAKTVTATAYEKLPTLFYYWDGNRNRKYQSLKTYGMDKDFKPRQGRITLTSIIGRGILHELETADYGEFKIHNSQFIMESAAIGLYSVKILSGKRQVAEIPVLCGKTESGKTLSDKECREILSMPMETYTENGRKTPHWLKGSGKTHELDGLVPVDELLTVQKERLSPAQTEEVEKMKLCTSAKKNELARVLNELEGRLKSADAERESITGDRLKLLAQNKKTALLRQDFMKKQESQFFDAMRLDMELEQQIREFLEKEKLTAKITREFVVEIKK